MAARSNEVTIRVNPQTLKNLRQAAGSLGELATGLVMVTDGAASKSKAAARI